MKKGYCSICFLTVFTASLLLAASFSNPARAQVWEGDYTIQSVQDIDGLTGYSEVTGTLLVGFSSNPAEMSPATATVFENLAGLESLTSVGGNLRFNYNDALTSLNGLEALTSVGGTLDIRNNSALTSLGALENLSTIGGDLLIGIDIFQPGGGNDALTSLTGLEGLTSVSGNVHIGDNNALTSLTGLENLTSVSGRLLIENNSTLTDLDGLENISRVDGAVIIKHNRELTSMNGLDRLAAAGDSLSIIDNNRLTSLGGLHSVTSVGGSLIIDENNMLGSLAGLDNLSSVGAWLQIINNDELIDLCSLYNLHINEDPGWATVYIYNNSLMSMDTAYALEAQLQHNGFTGTAEIHDNNGTGLISCETFVELSSLTAAREKRRVTVSWETAGEIDNAGFNLYRSATKNGEYIRLNTDLIPAEGSATQGASYEFVDEDVKTRRTYWYRLEDIDLNGTSTMHGPVSTKPRFLQGAGT